MTGKLTGKLTRECVCVAGEDACDLWDRQGWEVAGQRQISAKLDELIELNSTRANYADKFEELIESDNNGSRQIEDLFTELMALTASLNSEQQRHVRENMTEEELVIFDLPMKPAPHFTNKEPAEVKAAARSLLLKLKELLVLNWRQKASAHSRVQLAIEDELEN